MSKLRSPIIYFGGKGVMTAKLLKLIPEHNIYVEPFGGGASLLFAKLPSKVEVYNDIDSDVVNFFRVLRDEKKFEKFYKLVQLTPYSREEFNYCRRTWEECTDEIERAYRWFIVARMRFSGSFEGDWSFTLKLSRRNMAQSVSRWLSIIEMLSEIHFRIMRVQIENSDFRKIFETYDTKDTFFYCDPPYIIETRKSGGYKFEMTVDDYKNLINILLKLKGKVMLSGYKHEIYQPLEDAGWKRIDYKTACHAAGKTRGTKIQGEGAALKMQPRIESVWFSPNCDKSLKLF